MATGENVFEQQRHPYLRKGGHAGAHDPYPSPRHAPSKVLPWNAQQLADGLLVKPRGLTPPLAKLTMLTLL